MRSYERLKLKIKFFSGEESTIAETQLGSHSNNMSGVSFVENTRSQGKKIFELSASDVSEGITLTNANSYPGIVFDSAADENGNCDAWFTCQGENISAFVLHFDKTSKEHATLLSVNGKLFENKLDSFAVVGLENLSLLTVKILKWSKPLHHVKLTSLSLSFTEEFDKRFIKVLERNSALSSDNKKPDYGISAQSGRLVLQDRDDKLLNLAKSKVLRDGLNFQLILNGRTIGKYLSSNLEYSSLNNVATVELIDDIVNLQEEIFIGIDFPTVPSEVVPLSAREILTAFHPLVFKMDEATEAHLSSIIVSFPKMEQKDKYKSLIDFCKMTSSRVFKDEKGDLWIKALF